MDNHSGNMNKNGMSLISGGKQTDHTWTMDFGVASVAAFYGGTAAEDRPVMMISRQQRCRQVRSMLETQNVDGTVTIGAIRKGQMKDITQEV